MAKTNDWSPEDIERKTRVVTNLLRSMLAMFQECHPNTGQPCTRHEALWVVRAQQEAVLDGMTQKYGAEIAARYRLLIEEALEKLRHQ